MIIDFHVHTFPDKIASSALASLREISQSPTFTEGTLDDTVVKMKEWGIDRFAMLNIATTPKQQDSILRSCLAAREKYGDMVIPFPSVHPDADNALEMLDRFAEEGFRGIKLHPDYQKFFIDEEKMFPLYRKCAELGFMVIIHTGYDPVSPDMPHAPASRIAHLLDMLEAEHITGMKLIAAHMGACMRPEESMQYLVGRDIYFDSSFSAGIIEPELARKMIQGHGADKILFASDCPWHRSCDERDFISSLGLSAEDEEKIFHLNAEKLLSGSNSPSSL